MADPTVVTLLTSGLGAMGAAVVAQWRQSQAQLRDLTEALTRQADALESLQAEMRRLTDAVARMVTLVDERTERRASERTEPLRFPERRTLGGGET